MLNNLKWIWLNNFQCNSNIAQKVALCCTYRKESSPAQETIPSKQPLLCIFVLFSFVFTAIQAYQTHFKPSQSGRIAFQGKRWPPTSRITWLASYVRSKTDFNPQLWGIQRVRIKTLDPLRWRPYAEAQYKGWFQINIYSSKI